MLLNYPTCRIEEDDYIKEYIVDDYLGFDSITYSFNGKPQITILEERTEYSSSNSDEVTSLVQRTIKALTEVYGKTEIFESTFDYSKYDGTIYRPSCKILYTQDIFDLD